MGPSDIAQQRPVLPPDWVKVQSSSTQPGKDYYFNIRNKMSVWTIQEAMLPENNATPPKPSNQQGPRPPVTESEPQNSTGSENARPMTKPENSYTPNFTSDMTNYPKSDNMYTQNMWMQSCNPQLMCNPVMQNYGFCPPPNMQMPWYPNYMFQNPTFNPHFHQAVNPHFHQAVNSHFHPTVNPQFHQTVNPQFQIQTVNPSFQNQTLNPQMQNKNFNPQFLIQTGNHRLAVPSNAFNPIGQDTGQSRHSNIANVEDNMGMLNMNITKDQSSWTRDVQSDDLRLKLEARKRKRLNSTDDKRASLDRSPQQSVRLRRQSCPTVDSETLNNSDLDTWGEPTNKLNSVAPLDANVPVKGESYGYWLLKEAGASARKDIVYICIDTNVFLTDLDCIRQLILLDKENICRIVVPECVSLELDRLSKIGDSSYRAAGGCRMSNRLRRASQAKSFVEQQFQKSNSKFIRALNTSKNRKAVWGYYADENLIDCCVEFISENIHTILLTLDKNLTIRALSCHVMVYTLDRIKKLLLEVEEEIAERNTLINLKVTVPNKPTDTVDKPDSAAETLKMPNCSSGFTVRNAGPSGIQNKTTDVSNFGNKKTQDMASGINKSQNSGPFRFQSRAPDSTPYTTPDTTNCGLTNTQNPHGLQNVGRNSSGGIRMPDVESSGPQRSKMGRGTLFEISENGTESQTGDSAQNKDNSIRNWKNRQPNTPDNRKKKIQLFRQKKTTKNRTNESAKPENEKNGETPDQGLNIGRIRKTMQEDFNKGNLLMKEEVHNKLSLRMDEWVTQFEHIMVEMLTNVLLSEKRFYIVPPPWNLHEALCTLAERCRRERKRLSEMANAFAALVNQSCTAHTGQYNVQYTKLTLKSPDIFMKLYEEARKIITELKEAFNLPYPQEAETQLKDMLNELQYGTVEETACKQRRLSSDETTETTGNEEECDEDIAQKNKNAQVVEFLAKHYPQWAEVVWAELKSSKTAVCTKKKSKKAKTDKVVEKNKNSVKEPIVIRMIGSKIPEYEHLINKYDDSVDLEDEGENDDENQEEFNERLEDEEYVENSYGENCYGDLVENDNAVKSDEISGIDTTVEKNDSEIITYENDHDEVNNNENQSYNAPKQKICQLSFAIERAISNCFAFACHHLNTKLGILIPDRVTGEMEGLPELPAILVYIDTFARCLDDLLNSRRCQLELLRSSLSTLAPQVRRLPDDDRLSAACTRFVDHLTYDAFKVHVDFMYMTHTVLTKFYTDHCKKN